MNKPYISFQENATELEMLNCRKIQNYHFVFTESTLSERSKFMALLPGTGDSGLIAPKQTGNNLLDSVTLLREGMVGKKGALFSPCSKPGLFDVFMDAKDGSVILTFLPKKRPSILSALERPERLAAIELDPILLVGVIASPYGGATRPAPLIHQTSSRVHLLLPLPCGAFPPRLYLFWVDEFSSSWHSWSTPAFADATKVTMSISRFTWSCFVILDVFCIKTLIMRPAGTLAHTMLPWMARRSHALAQSGSAVITCHWDQACVPQHLRAGDFFMEFLFYQRFPPLCPDIVNDVTVSPVFSSFDISPETWFIHALSLTWEPWTLPWAGLTVLLSTLFGTSSSTPVKSMGGTITYWSGSFGVEVSAGADCNWCTSYPMFSCDRWLVREIATPWNLSLDRLPFFFWTRLSKSPVVI